MTEFVRVRFRTTGHEADIPRAAFRKDKHTRVPGAPVTDKPRPPKYAPAVSSSAGPAVVSASTDVAEPTTDTSTATSATKES